MSCNVSYNIGFYCLICVVQCVDEGQGSEESAFTSPRLLSSSDMKVFLQWEESESHPLTTLEKQITVQITPKYRLTLPWRLVSSH